MLDLARQPGTLELETRPTSASTWRTWCWTLLSQKCIKYAITHVEASKASFWSTETKVLPISQWFSTTDAVMWTLLTISNPTHRIALDRSSLGSWASSLNHRTSWMSIVISTRVKTSSSHSQEAKTATLEIKNHSSLAASFRQWNSQVAEASQTRAGVHSVPSSERVVQALFRVWKLSCSRKHWWERFKCAEQQITRVRERRTLAGRLIMELVVKLTTLMI